MTGRGLAEAVLRDVIAACDPARRVREALAAPACASRLGDRRRIGVAAGKAALAMARGAGPVADGVAVVPHGTGGALPAGWRLLEAAHPLPDALSVAAGRAVLAAVTAARADDVVLALISGGASALIEVPRVPLDELVATVRALMAAGAPIADLNAVRGALSEIKAGQLARASAAPVITLAVSDVIGDLLAVIGSGPTVDAFGGNDLRSRIDPRQQSAGGGLDPGGPADDAARAREVLVRHGVAIPAALASSRTAAARPPRAWSRDHAVVIAPMRSAAEAAQAALAARAGGARLVAAPITGEPAAIADALVASGDALVAWGEPTPRLPSRHGVGGRAQQLALELAERLRGGARGAFVVGTDGVDGPAPPDRPTPAGAWVDGTTWDAIARAGLDPAMALARCDAGPALAAVNALVVTGPTGINHADLVLLL